MSSSSTEAVPAQYRNLIVIRGQHVNGPGAFNFAHVDQTKEWVVPVSYTPTGVLPPTCRVQIGPQATILTSRVTSVTGIGEYVSLDWEADTANQSFTFKANPFSAPMPEGKYQVIFDFTSPTTQRYQLNAVGFNAKPWYLAMGIHPTSEDAAAVFSLILDNGKPPVPVEEGDFTQTVVSDIVALGIEKLKGTWKIGYTLT
jgi:hypothetical protein